MRLEDVHLVAATDAVDGRRHQWRRPERRAQRLGARLAARTPGETIYTITAPATLPRITALRLEALPDPSLPKGGPGRDVYGNFQVNGIRESTAGPTTSFAPSNDSRRSRRTTPQAAAATWTASSPRSRRATAPRREAGASTPPATKAACPGRSCSRSTSRSTAPSGRNCESVLTHRRHGRRAGARPIPAVGERRRDTGANRRDSREAPPNPRCSGDQVAQETEGGSRAPFYRSVARR